MSQSVLAPGIVARDAGPEDNAVLLALTAACPMVGDITMCVEREPDFFALGRLEGDLTRVAVVDLPGAKVAGCVAVAERCVWFRGSPRSACYAFDLKVHPRHRGSGTVDALIQWVVESGRAFGGDDIPALITILAGNRAMERIAEGPRGLPVLARFATIRAHAIPLLFKRRPADAGLRIAPADERDVEPMMALWQRVAPRRQFAPDFDAERFTAWVGGAPGLSIHDYWVAKKPGGEVAGFVGIWDQRAMKQLRILAYSTRLALARLAINAAGRILGGATLPPAGSTLRTATAVHVCVPAESPGVLHALLRRATGDLRARGFAVCTIGLDRRDPLTAALGGFGAQPTDVNGCITTPAGRYTGPNPADRPFHYDIAMV